MYLRYRTGFRNFHPPSGLLAAVFRTSRCRSSSNPPNSFSPVSGVRRRRRVRRNWVDCSTNSNGRCEKLRQPRVLHRKTGPIYTRISNIHLHTCLRYTSYAWPDIALYAIQLPDHSDIQPVWRIAQSVYRNTPHNVMIFHFHKKHSIQGF